MNKAIIKTKNCSLKKDTISQKSGIVCYMDGFSEFCVIWRVSLANHHIHPSNVKSNRKQWVATLITFSRPFPCFCSAGEPKVDHFKDSFLAGSLRIPLSVAKEPSCNRKAALYTRLQSSAWKQPRAIGICKKQFFQLQPRRRATGTGLSQTHYDSRDKQ